MVSRLRKLRQFSRIRSPPQSRIQCNSADEDRFVILGTSGRGRLLVVVFAENEEDVIGIISARRATRHERIAYEEGQ
jgi:hypothetical protein